VSYNHTNYRHFHCWKCL